MNSVNVIITNAIKARLAERDWTWAHLARALKTGESHLAHSRADRRPWGYPTLQKIEKAFNGTEQPDGSLTGMLPKEEGAEVA